MKLGDFIQRNHIVDKLKARSKEEAIAELVDVLVRTGEIRHEDREEVLIALLKREALSHTGIGMGVAVPHAVVKSVKGVIGALGVSQGGVRFSGNDPAHVIFLFVSPNASNPQDHLKLMALVSRLAGDPEYIRLLQRAKTRPGITRLIREAEDRIYPSPPAEYL
ncbi:MAG: PTS sugar transporter subunit IIA [Planctomycetota bacterium]|jgi:mannitol/fructose-specific phosphotransferase system IIA component (Ntr-type)